MDMWFGSGFFFFFVRCKLLLLSQFYLNLTSSCLSLIIPHLCYSESIKMPYSWRPLTNICLSRMLSQERQRGMAFATGKTAQAALRAGGDFQPPGRGRSLWVTRVYLQDRGEGGHRLLGGMSILFLSQTQLAQNTISPCGETSSLNNMDRKCWSIQKKSSRSHSKKNGWRQRRAWCHLTVNGWLCLACCWRSQ